MCRKNLLWSVSIGIVLTLLTLLLLTPRPQTADAAPSSVVRYVLDNGGVDSGQCDDSQAPCATIQYALSQASSGDEIRIANRFAPALYTEALKISVSLALQGGWNATAFPGGLIWNRPAPCEAARTTIDAQGSARVITINGGGSIITPSIDCLTISGGDASGLGGDPGSSVDNDAGGGIYSQNAAPIISNNIISGNYGCNICPTAYGRGGGIYLINAPASSIISGNQVLNNVADESTWGQGGGIMLRNSDTQVLHNRIQNNRAGHSAGDGGGLTIKGGHPSIANNTFISNVAGTSVLGNGGGIFVFSGGSALIEHNLLQNNIAISGTSGGGMISHGGGIAYIGTPTGTAIIRNNQFLYNSAAPYAPHTGYGGGLYLENLAGGSEVQSNTLQGNVAGFNNGGQGGGIFAENSNLSISDNRIVDNAGTQGGAEGSGGGIFINRGNALIAGNVISGNRGTTIGGSGRGGGVALSATVSTLQDNQLLYNRATYANALGAGGGVYGYTSTVSIRRNLIQGNHATWDNYGFGGGLYLESGNYWLDSNRILDNVASDLGRGRGGGVRITFSPIFTLTNNIIARNSASELASGVGIAAYSSGILAHNTIAENSSGDGSGVHVSADCTLSLYNNIVFSHTLGISNTAPASSTVIAAHTLFEDNLLDYSSGVSSSSPVPAPAALTDDYHLGSNSAARDAGSVLAWITEDIDGDPRSSGAAPDVGADEATCLARRSGLNYPTIQGAINAAGSGETIQVAAGTCYENLAITQTLTLEGGWQSDFSARHSDPAAYSTIHGAHAGRAVSITHIASPISPTLDGFTISGGDASGLGGSAHGYDIGGGIYSYNANTHIVNCDIKDNLASSSGIGWGGGVGIFGGETSLRQSSVHDNIASSANNGYGGGVYLRHGETHVISNSIYNNSASTASNGWGGGIEGQFNEGLYENNHVHDNIASSANEGSGGGIGIYFAYANLDANTIESNIASSANNGYGDGIFIEGSDKSILNENIVQNNQGSTRGGGVYLINSADVALQSNLIRNNHAQSNGGGIYLNLSPNAYLRANHVLNNQADSGAGVYLYGEGSPPPQTTLINNIIADNIGASSGTALYIKGVSATLKHNTLAHNHSGSGIYVTSGSADLVNTILVSHTLGIYVSSDSSVTLESTLWGSDTWANLDDWDGSGSIFSGTHNFWALPHFVAPQLSDYHLAPGSAAIDKGTPSSVNNDIDGDPRPIGAYPDIGADEAQRTLHLPTVMKNQN